MEKEERIRKYRMYRKWFSIAVAFVLAGMILYFGYQSMAAKAPDQSWRIVALGDSIIGKEREGEAVHLCFEKYTGVPMLNAAFGGNLASKGQHADRYSYHEESLNLYALAEAVCYQDFGVQKADLAASETRAWYFEESLGGLERADLWQTEILLLEFGVNDYMAGKRTDDSDDPYNVNTYGGALRYSIELFQKNYPDLKIVFVTPAFCYVVDQGLCTEADFGGGTLERYVETEKGIAAEYGLDVIDAFYEFGIDETNVMEYTEDGMHLSVEGRQKYARFLAEKLGIEALNEN